MLIVLESVATAIDDQTLMTYAMYESGDVDMDSELHLTKCSKDWYNGLNQEDKEMVNHLLNIKNYLK
jgi:hypothetical protein